MTAVFHVGDAIEVMSKLPEKSVDLILTSPPFLALRSYLPADHPDKAKEGGSQSTPGAFIDWLIDVVEACDRVLAPHGSLCIELGDTYAGGGGGPDSSGLVDKGHQHSELNRMTKLMRANHQAWPLAKSLSLIPESFRFAMVYGRNPFTGRTTEPWRLRNVVRWVRPNPPVGALGDKFRPATSELMVFCKSAKRYFDLDAVRTEHVDGRLSSGGGSAISNGVPRGFHGDIQSNPAGAPPLDWWNIPLARPQQLVGLLIGKDEFIPQDIVEKHYPFAPPPGERVRAVFADTESVSNTELFSSALRQRCVHGRYDEHGFSPYGKPSSHRPVQCPGGEFLATDLQAPLDWWNIPPGGYEGAHYAVFPPELCVKPVKAMCPQKVCRVCGEPSRRIVEKSEEYAEARARIGDKNKHRTGVNDVATGNNGDNRAAQLGTMTAAEYVTTGWTTCGHGDWRPGLVLDPFAGSGTTLAVATGHGRDAIGIDLDERNYDLALERVGPFILERAR